MRSSTPWIDARWASVIRNGVKGRRAATDSRHFHRVWPRVYRFTPFRMTDAQRASIHGVDERIGVTDLHDGVAWYRRLIEQL